METVISGRFLVVDDEPANVRLLARMLDKWQAAEMVSTTDSRETLALFRHFKPDIVLLDLMMPELDGFAVMELLRAELPPGKPLPVVVLTADTDQKSRHRALESGAADYLNKPFDATELFLRLRNLLASQALHHQLEDQNHTLEEQVEDRTKQLELAELETVECLATAAEYRDDDTGQHTQRVGHTAARIAAVLGHDEKYVDLIRRAATLHDVGKIGIPDGILLKPGKLTDEEFAFMKRHTIIGAEILARHHTPLLQLASSIALSHHERWDGSGYPKRLAAGAIPEEGSIVAVADVFDALTHERPYKQAWPLEKALAEILSQSGRQFAPRVIEAFLTLPHAEFL